MAVRFRNHTISHGDTIQYIAQKYLDDMTRWVDVARFNNLKYPYIVDTNEEKLENPDHLATIGDVLLIKLEEDEQSEMISDLKSITEYDKDEIYALALGKDLDIEPIPDQYGYIINEEEKLELEGDPQGDLKTTRGMENLKQALYIKLITPKGSYVGHPRFGSEVDKYIGRKNTKENATLLALEIERTIKTDGRVSKVKKLDSYLTGRSVKMKFSISTIDLEDAFEFVIGASDEGIVILEDEFQYVDSDDLGMQP